MSWYGDLASKAYDATVGGIVRDYRQGNWIGVAMKAGALVTGVAAIAVAAVPSLAVGGVTAAGLAIASTALAVGDMVVDGTRDAINQLNDEGKWPKNWPVPARSSDPVNAPKQSSEVPSASRAPASPSNYVAAADTHVAKEPVQSAAVTPEVAAPTPAQPTAAASVAPPARAVSANPVA